MGVIVIIGVGGGVLMRKLTISSDVRPSVSVAETMKLCRPALRSLLENWAVPTEVADWVDISPSISDVHRRATSFGWSSLSAMVASKLAMF